MTQLLIGTGLALPEETIVGKVGIVGMSGSGKTQTARKLAEAMQEIDQHIAVLDPTGAWWGLRSSADGLEAGYPIVVFGGTRGDAPLRVDAGAMLGNALVSERFNAIFDMSGFDDAAIRRFSTDFLNAIYSRNHHPLHIFMDEFDIICPQAKGANSEEARTAVNAIVRRGRLKGIGSTMITQNPQDADKSVLNMADTVIAMRTQGSQAIDAIGKWMGRNLAKPVLEGLVTSLPELQTGTGWVWAPQSKTFAITSFHLCRTFDSGKTPRLGERIAPPKVLAQVDIQKLGERIAADAEKAKEDSPEHLRERIRELEASASQGGQQDMGFIEEAQAAQKELEELRDRVETLQSVEARYYSIIKSTQEAIRRITSEFLTLDLPAPNKTHSTPPSSTLFGLSSGADLPAAQIPKASDIVYAPQPLVRPPTQPAANEQVNLRGKSMAMLAVCAGMYPAGLTEAQVAMQSGMKRTGGTFGDYKSLLKTSGCIEIRDGLWYATKEGMRRAGSQIPSRPTTTDQVLALWNPKLRGKSRDMLALLVRHRGRWVSYADLATAVGISDKGGTFGDYLSLLRTTGLIITEGGKARANAEVLFL